MNFRAPIAATLVVALLAGCAPATMRELRQKPGSEVSFQTMQNYQAVYRTVLSNARRCHQFGMITAQWVVQGDLYTDTQAGEVTVALHGGLGVSTYLGVDIKAIGSHMTEVRVVSFSSNRDTTRAVQGWVEGRSNRCSL